MAKLPTLPIATLKKILIESLPQTVDLSQNRLLAIIFFAYLITGYVGLHTPAVSAFASLIWPPAGIAFAAFLLYGYRVWPAVFFAAFIVNSTVGVSLPIALCMAIGNTLGPIAGVSFAKWYSNYDFEVLRLRDNIGIIGSAFVVPFITATVGVGGLWLGGVIHAEMFAGAWTAWWMGDLLGTLILAPFILKWFSRPLFYRTPIHYAELTLAAVIVSTFAFVIFWSSFTPFAYGLFIPLTWVALRTGPRGMTLALLLSAIVAVSGTVGGHGPFASMASLNLQIYLTTMSVVFHIFTAVVAERKRVFTTLERHVDELEVALNRISSEDEAKKEFLAVLAHELRNPLATVLSSVELIHLQGLSAPSSKMLIDTIADRARAMVHLLDDLLDISRISQKKLSLQRQTVAVDDFIDKLALTAQPLISKYGHLFSIKRPEEKLFLDADPVRLEQIFMNLIINASKYTKTPGSIDITVRKDGDMVATHIRDSGIGIPPNMLSRIFEPFFQVKRTGSREGIGIGLPLTRQLVEMHGGTIEARSEGLGTGSEFIVRLPLLKGGTQKAAEVGPPAVPFAERRRTPRKAKHPFKILVVDDNGEAIEALEQLFTMRGHSVAVAHNGLEAVRKAPHVKPDVIFLDIGLPDIDGYEVARRLRMQKKHYYITALTGYGQPEDVAKAKEAGFDYHLTKPASFVDIENLLRKVRRTLESRGK